MKTSLLIVIITLAACSPQPEEAGEAKNASQSVLLESASVVVDTPIVNDCNLTLGFDAWEPYQYADVGGRVTGLDIELISNVANNIGCDIIFEQGTWVDLLSALKEGDIDMLLGASKTPAREEYAFFSHPYRMEEFSLYIRKNDKTHANDNSLSEFIENGGRIGVVSDYIYGEEVTALLDDPKKSEQFVNAIMGELNVARLLDQDIDGFLEDSFVGASMLRRKALTDYIVPQGVTIETGNIYVMFSQQAITPEQLAMFNEELNRVKESQIYTDLLNKYSF